MILFSRFFCDLFCFLFHMQMLCKFLEISENNFKFNKNKLFLVATGNQLKGGCG
jgi:hypothetical protein